MAQFTLTLERVVRKTLVLNVEAFNESAALTALQLADTDGSLEDLWAEIDGSEQLVSIECGPYDPGAGGSEFTIEMDVPVRGSREYKEWAREQMERKMAELTQQLAAQGIDVEAVLRSATE